MPEIKWDAIDEIFFEDCCYIKDGDAPDYMDYYIASFVQLNGKWGIVQYDGSEIFSPQWDRCEEMKTGYTCVADRSELFNKWGYPLDLREEDGWQYAVLKDTYFFSRVAKVGKYGVVDTSGRVITPCRWDEIDDSGNVRQGDKWGFVNLLTCEETLPQWPENRHQVPKTSFWTATVPADGFGWEDGSDETMTLF